MKVFLDYFFVAILFLAVSGTALHAQEDSTRLYRANQPAIGLRSVRSYEFSRDNHHRVVCLNSLDVEGRGLGARLLSMCANMDPAAMRISTGRYGIIKRNGRLQVRSGAEIGGMIGRESDLFLRPYAEVALVLINRRSVFFDADQSPRTLRIDVGVESSYYYGFFWAREPRFALITSVSF